MCFQNIYKFDSLNSFAENSPFFNNIYNLMPYKHSKF